MTTGWEIPKKDERKMGNNLLIVDGLNLSFRYKHQGAKTFAKDYIDLVNSLAKSYSCTDKIVLSDLKGSKYRKELYPEYKGNRDYSNQTDEEKLKAEEFFAEYNNTLDMITESDDLEGLWHKGIEADDFMGVLVPILKERYDNIWLISTDADWDEFLDDNVHRFACVSRSRKEFFFSNFYDDHGCDTTEQFVMMKCLMGDKSDNIRGVEGVGVKRAYQILRPYETIFDLIDALPLAGNQKFIQHLNASADLLERNLELMDLRTFSPEIVAEAGQEAMDKVDRLVQILPRGLDGLEDLDELDLSEINDLD